MPLLIDGLDADHVRSNVRTANAVRLVKKALIKLKRLEEQQGAQ